MIISNRKNLAYGLTGAMMRGPIPKMFSKFAARINSDIDDFLTDEDCPVREWDFLIFDFISADYSWPIKFEEDAEVNAEIIYEISLEDPYYGKMQLRVSKKQPTEYGDILYLCWWRYEDEQVWDHMKVIAIPSANGE